MPYTLIYQYIHWYIYMIYQLRYKLMSISWIPNSVCEFEVIMKHKRLLWISSESSFDWATLFKRYFISPF